MPTQWEEALVTYIYKGKGKKAEVSSYTPPKKMMLHPQFILPSLDLALDPALDPRVRSAARWIRRPCVGSARWICGALDLRDASNVSRLDLLGLEVRQRMGVWNEHLQTLQWRSSRYKVVKL